MFPSPPPSACKDQISVLEEEFLPLEVKQTIQDAYEVSAPVLLANIAFFKLLFTAVPTVVTKGLNHLVFVPHLLANDDFPWICH
jgi:hypothetical protein